ncbi:MAG TPA: biotin/lipoyl-binding protein, partial [Ancylobacter sp.]
MTIAAPTIGKAERTQPPADLPPELTGAGNKVSSSANSPANSPAKPRSLLRLALPAILLAGVIGGGGYAGWEYWTLWRFQASTDDAYVQADVISIAPQVAGNIATLLVDDNQPVKAGQVLAVIDQRDFQAAVDQAKAGVE